MNATPMNINPVNAAPTNAAPGKQADSAAPEVPFSQVLSSEMAQSRRNSHSVKEDTDAAADIGLEAAALVVRPTDAGVDATGLVLDAGDVPADPPTLPQADSPSAVPDALLALGIPVDQLKPAPAATGDAVAEAAPVLAAIALPLQDARKDKAPLAVQADPPEHPDGDAPRGAAKSDPAPLTGKADAQADKAAATTAFAGQLAAARQAETVKTREAVSELANNPALRPIAQGPLDPLPMHSESVTPRLHPPVGTGAWNQALGEKIVWMAAGTQQSATLTLNPPDMGPLQIVLNVSNEQATASFFSAQPEVRQALEAAFPRLREMMSEAGIQLGQATVSADTPQQQNNAPDRQSPRVAAAFPGTDEAIAASLQTTLLPPRQSGRGLIDTFA